MVLYSLFFSYTTKSPSLSCSTPFKEELPLEAPLFFVYMLDNLIYIRELDILNSGLIPGLIVLVRNFGDFCYNFPD